MKQLGVVIGRFQTSSLTEAHSELIDSVINCNTYTLVLVGKAPVMSARNPIPARFIEGMIRSSYNDVLVDTISDHPDDGIWAHSVMALAEQYAKKTGCEFINFYGGRDNGLKPLTMQGFSDYIKFCVHEATEVFPELKKYSDVSATKSRQGIIDWEPNSKMVREGFILAEAERYPTVYSTVDVALFDSDPRYIWMGQKYPGAGLCFIGGFVDPNDPSRADAAIRETQEETGGLCGLALRTEEGEIGMRYIGETQIKDWRYAGTKDAVLTTLFATQLTKDSAKPKASDDMYSFRKVKFDCLEKAIIAPQHHKLFSMLSVWHETGIELLTSWN